MIEVGLEPLQDERTVYVQEEPALEIAIPEVFAQPLLTVLQRGKQPRVEALVGQIFRRYQADPSGPLGRDYQELVTEFQPLFAWSLACWDYLLTTEGCRFIPRRGEHRLGARGDYRAVTDNEYSRMVHGIFRRCVLEFAQQPSAPSLAGWLRERFWPAVLDAYRQLEHPPDPRQRTLTAYSYLRCVPYQFLNDYHHELVHVAVQRLPERASQAINAYFLHFFTEAASAQAVGCAVEEFLAALRQGLIRLLLRDRLVYCLLRQIERY